MRIIDGIPVCGEHDEATVAQIRRCAADPEAAGAALLADGHKGYSMPIGGGVAYRDAVSPSGVGYDISCLGAGTRVSTGVGYVLPIERVGAAGWRPAGELRPGDLVACNSFVGLPFEPVSGELPLELAPAYQEQLAERGLYPLRCLRRSRRVRSAAR